MTWKIEHGKLVTEKNILMQEYIILKNEV